jgi:hypothetical protein
MKSKVLMPDIGGWVVGVWANQRALVAHVRHTNSEGDL